MSHVILVQALVAATRIDTALTEWITYDKQYKINHFQLKGPDPANNRDIWDLLEKAPTGGDWTMLEKNTTKARIQKRLSIILYPPDSTPSTEYSGLGAAPQHLWGSDHVEVCQTGPPDRE